jgi:hypothetical protein
MYFQLCAKTLAPPKLVELTDNYTPVRVPISTRSASQRAQHTIVAITQALHDGCHYCSSGDYEVPHGGCPCRRSSSRRTTSARRTESRDERPDPRTPIEYRPATILSVR